MKRILFLSLFSTLILGCTPERQQNIVLIVADDLGWRDVNYNDNPYFITPAINELANEGMVFTNAYANAPNCAPSRAAMLTGMYSPRHGIYTVSTAARGKSINRKLIPVENTTVLDTSFVTFADILQEKGYATAHFGKWHMGEGEFFGPTGQGFDKNFGGTHLGHPKSYFSPYKNSELEDGPEGEHLADRLSSEAVSFIKENQNNPFLVYIPYYSVHTPIQAKEEMVSTYVERESPLKNTNPKYGAMVETMDQGIASILQTIRDLDLWEHTTIIFISDNGPYLPASSAEPLRGSKGMLYEGGIRVPLVIKHGSSSGKTNVPVIGMDLFPTLLDIAGIQSPGNEDGISLLPLLDENNNVNRDLHWHFPAYLGKYPGMEDPWRTTPAAAIRSGNWKLIEFFEDGTLELYNLENDLSETFNLADSLPAKRDELHSKMREWRKETGAFIPTELNPEFIPLDEQGSL